MFAKSRRIFSSRFFSGATNFIHYPDLQGKKVILSQHLAFKPHSLTETFQALPDHKLSTIESQIVRKRGVNVLLPIIENYEKNADGTTGTVGWACDNGQMISVTVLRHSNPKGKSGTSAVANCHMIETGSLAAWEARNIAPRKKPTPKAGIKQLLYDTVLGQSGSIQVDKQLKGVFWPYGRNWLNEFDSVHKLMKLRPGLLVSPMSGTQTCHPVVILPYFGSFPGVLKELGISEQHACDRCCVSCFSIWKFPEISRLKYLNLFLCFFVLFTFRQSEMFPC